MKYFRVKPEADGRAYARRLPDGRLACLTSSKEPYTYAVGGELLTEREFKLTGIPRSMVELVSVSQRETFILFGYRQPYSDADVRLLE